MDMYEILKAVEIQVGESVEDDSLIAIINKVLNLIAENANLYSLETVKAEANIWYELPKNIIQIEELLFTGVPYENYKYLNCLISFADAGTYQILAKSLPERIKSINDQFDVHEIFRNLIIDYCSTYIERGQGEQKISSLEIETAFKRQASALARQLQKKKPPKQWKVER